MGYETWYRGEGAGVQPARPGGHLHDFGDGMYLTDNVDVANWNRNRPGIKIMKATDLTPFSLDVPKSTSAAENPILGTWKLRSLVFEAIATGQRSSLFGDHPVGYLGYSPDGRMLRSALWKIVQNHATLQALITAGGSGIGRVIARR